MIRIALDTRNLSAVKDGVAVYVDQLMAALHQVAPWFSYQPIAGRAPTRPLRIPARIWWEQVQFPWYARRAQATLLHQPAHAVPRLANRPVVVTVHDIIPRVLPQPTTTWADRYFAEWVPATYRWATHVIADSLHTQRDLVAVLGIDPEKITVVPLAADPTYQPITDQSRRRAVQAQYGLASPYLIHVGTISPRKNLEFLVRVFGALARRYPRLTLVITGQPEWQHERLVALVGRLGLASRVRLTGYLSETDKPFLIAGAQALVFPSLYEGFGLPPLEAMALGVPVVSSNATSLPEVVGTGGLLVDPRDEAAWVAALRSLLDRPRQRTAWIARGLARAKQFSWRKTAAQTAAVYARVLGASIRPGPNRRRGA